MADMDRFRPASPEVRAFLASAGLGGLGEWVKSEVHGSRRVVFVDAAAVPMTDASFVAANRTMLEDLGLRVQHLDITRTNRTEVVSAIDHGDAVFVTGGYPAFLLEKAQKTGFLDAVLRRVVSGDLAYIGVSAGAALAGRDMAPLIAPDDPGVVRDSTCMAVVPFVPLPHVNRRPPENVSERQQAFPGLELVPLTDVEAIQIACGAITIVASP